MLTNFTKYFLNTKADFDDALANGYIVFDTNVLLDVLRAGKDFSDTFYKIFNHMDVKDRIRLPYHAAEEFAPKYFEVLYTTINDLENIKVNLQNLYSGLKIHRALFPELKDSLKGDLKKVLDKYAKQIDKKIKEVKAEIMRKQMLKMLSTVFDGKLLPAFTPDEIKSIEKEGVERYGKSIPPGYKDAKKTDNKYGDLILWKEILKLAETEPNKAVIFVSGDVKEDWIAEYNGQKQGLRYELRKEFGETGNNKFVHRYDVVELISLLNKRYNIIDNKEESKAKKTYEKMQPETQTVLQVPLNPSFVSSYPQTYPLEEIMRATQAFKGLTPQHLQGLSELTKRLAAMPVHLPDFSAARNAFAGIKFPKTDNEESEEDKQS